jgi:hypothetical protein
MEKILKRDVMHVISKFKISALQKMIFYEYLANLKKYGVLRLAKLSEHLNFIKRTYPYHLSQGLSPVLSSAELKKYG